MPLKSVKYVTGNQRYTVEAANRHLLRILAYNDKQPDGSYLLPSQVTALETAQSVLAALLAAQRFV